MILLLCLPLDCTVCRQQLAVHQHQPVIKGSLHVTRGPQYAASPAVHQAQRTKLAKPLVEKAARAILLSGTPALSNPSELLTQLQALLPRARITKAAFEERYMDVRHYGKFSKAVSGAATVAVWLWVVWGGRRRGLRGRAALRQGQRWQWVTVDTAGWVSPGGVGVIWPQTVCM